MKDRLKKVVNIIGIVIISITAVLAILFFLGLDNPTKIENNFSILYFWTLIMIILTALTAFLVGPIMNILQNPKGVSKSIYFIGGFLLLIVLAFLIAKGDPNTILMSKKPENIATVAYYTEAGILTFYFIGIVAIIAVIGSEIRNILK